MICGAVSLAVAENPESMTRNKERLQDVLMSGVGFIFSVRKVTKGVVMLEKGPQGDDVAAE
jgi:hypothetical protein